LAGMDDGHEFGWWVGTGQRGGVLAAFPRAYFWPQPSEPTRGQGAGPSTQSRARGAGWGYKLERAGRRAAGLLGIKRACAAGARRISKRRASVHAGTTLASWGYIADTGAKVEAGPWRARRRIDSVSARQVRSKASARTEAGTSFAGLFFEATRSGAGVSGWPCASTSGARAFCCGRYFFVICFEFVGFNKFDSHSARRVRRRIPSEIQSFVCSAIDGFSCEQRC
jgi:hypothetical protein